MNKETEVLYKIFELELSPPFSLERNELGIPQIYNKFSERIAYRRSLGSCLVFHMEAESPIFFKIKRTFNVDKISNDDLYHIAKHLFNWIKDKSPMEFERIECYNYNTGEYARYPN